MKLLDHGLPLGYLIDVRRRIVEQLAKSETPGDPEFRGFLQELAVLQQAIAAVEAVIAEKDQEPLRKVRPPASSP